MTPGETTLTRKGNIGWAIELGRGAEDCYVRVSRHACAVCVRALMRCVVLMSRWSS